VWDLTSTGGLVVSGTYTQVNWKLPSPIRGKTPGKEVGKSSGSCRELSRPAAEESRFLRSSAADHQVLSDARVFFQMKVELVLQNCFDGLYNLLPAIFGDRSPETCAASGVKVLLRQMLYGNKEHQSVGILAGDRLRRLQSVHAWHD